MVLAAVLVAVSWLTAPKALAQPTRVQYLPVAEDTEWVGVVVSPDGSRAYLAEYVNSISVIDTADDSLEARFELPSPEDEWIGGMAFSPDGRFVVSTDTAIYEIDPETGDMLAETAPPFSSWWEGPLVFTQDGSRAYLASVDEIFVLDLESFTVVDTTPDDAELGGLLAANPSWTDSWARAYDIAISPDDDRLYVLGEDSSEGD